MLLLRGFVLVTSTIGPRRKVIVSLKKIRLYQVTKADDDLHRWICEVTHFSGPIFGLLYGNLHLHKQAMAPSWEWPLQRDTTCGDCTDVQRPCGGDASVVKIGRGKAGNFESLWHGKMGSILSEKRDKHPASAKLVHFFQVAQQKVKSQGVTVLTLEDNF